VLEGKGRGRGGLLLVSPVSSRLQQEKTPLVGNDVPLSIAFLILSFSARSSFSAFWLSLENCLAENFRLNIWSWSFESPINIAIKLRFQLDFQVKPM
jgi:hypothetical protein